MYQSRTAPSTSNLHRRIGRKVLQADRLARALTPSKPPKQSKLKSYFPTLRPKVLVAICLAVIVLGVVGYTVGHAYSVKAELAQKAAAAELQTKIKTKRLAADACRRKKVEEKSSQIGKLTYDQLYDNNECDK